MEHIKTKEVTQGCGVWWLLQF